MVLKSVWVVVIFDIYSYFFSVDSL